MASAVVCTTPEAPSIAPYPASRPISLMRQARRAAEVAREEYVIILTNLVSNSDTLGVRNVLRQFRMEDGAGLRELLRTVVTGGNVETLKALVSGTGVSPASQGMVEALVLAAENGLLEMVSCLLTMGVSARVECSRPIVRAAMNGHLSVCQLLEEWGADPCTISDIALRRAASNDHSEVVGWLLEHGADISACEYEAIWMAAAKGHARMARSLILGGGPVPSEVVADALRKIRATGQADSDMECFAYVLDT